MSIVSSSDLRSSRKARLVAFGMSGALALSLAAGSTAPAAGAPAEPGRAAEASPGAHSIGDSLFPDIGNGGYNVKHYSIKLNYASGSISASTTVTAEAKKRLSSFSLDLEGLDVTRVRVNGRTASFSRYDNKLVITPAGPVRGTFKTKINYSGKPVTHVDPDGSSDGWIPSDDGATVLAEPVGSMTWFPNNNTPRDKARFDISVKVPAALEVAASGDLKSRKRHGAHRTWVWKQRKPMATYLAMISIGNYDVYQSTMTTRDGRKLPIWSFIEPKLGPLADERALVPRVIRFAEKRFGPYPFDSAGIVVKDLKVGYALETQNRPVFDGEADTETIVHEFAHQWYGNSVTARDWGDIWLAEGFADYSESWWDAAHGGDSRAEHFTKVYDANPESADLWSPAPAALGDAKNLFAPAVYARGGLSLEALRQTVGDRDFNTILKRWASLQRGKSVSTAQFVALAEQVSDRNLGSFFHSWLYVAKRPDRP